MNIIQLKIIHYTKTKEDLKLIEKKNQQMPKSKYEMLQLSDKDFEASTIKMLQWTTVNTFETAEKIESLTKEIGSLKKDIEDIKN